MYNKINLLHHRYDPKVRLQIARYACFHGVTAAALHFSRKLECRIQPSTVQFIKEAYLNEIKKMRAVGNTDPMNSLPHRKKGRPLLLGEKIDAIVQLYVKKVRATGGGVSSTLVIGAATGFLKSLDKTGAREHLELNRFWAHSLLRRMNFVQRKGTTALSKYSFVDFDGVKKEFLDNIVTTVEMEEIPAELILNWDQTGIKIVPSYSWTMNLQGERRVELVGLSDKRQITAIFCGNLL